MSRRSLALALGLALVHLGSGGARAWADESRASAAVGTWSGGAGVKLDGGGVEAFVMRVEKTGTGYAATTRADVLLPAGGGAAGKSLVVAAYEGEAKEDGLHFRSTQRLRSVDGAAPVVLAPATLVVKRAGDAVDVNLGNEAEGTATLRLVASGVVTEVQPPGAIRGEWGGEMPHAKLSENVILDELYVTVPAEGPFAADVRMECTVMKSGQKIPVTIVANYRDGSAKGDEVHFAIVPWHRTVPSTGQKDDIQGNPLVLRVTSEGRLAGVFEGDDGWPFTLVRKSVASPKPGLDDFVGGWGGAFKDAKLSDTLLIREGTLDLGRGADGTWTATVHFTFVVKTDGDDVLVKADGDYPPGKIEGDAIKFPGTTLTRTIVSTGATNPMEGNPLEVRREPDGRAELKFVGDGGFTLTMARR